MPILRSLKQEKSVKRKLSPRCLAADYQAMPKFPQQTTFGTLFMDIVKKSSSGEHLHENCGNVFFKKGRQFCMLLQ